MGPDFCAKRASGLVPESQNDGYEVKYIKDTLEVPQYEDSASIAHQQNPTIFRKGWRDAFVPLESYFVATWAPTLGVHCVSSVYYISGDVEPCSREPPQISQPWRSINGLAGRTKSLNSIPRFCDV